AFLCTDLSVPPRTVLEWFNRRWAMETTYEESRAHLGIETQRQWADPAVFRTAPLLFGLYSLITLYVHQNAGRLALSPRRAIWYPKPAPTFADALARLRQHLWFEQAAMSPERRHAQNAAASPSTARRRRLLRAVTPVTPHCCWMCEPAPNRDGCPKMRKVEQIVRSVRTYAELMLRGGTASIVKA
ncbi:hypothetical protein ACFPMG_24845, partial [Azospirillum himalayense]